MRNTPIIKRGIPLNKRKNLAYPTLSSPFLTLGMDGTFHANREKQIPKIRLRRPKKKMFSSIIGIKTKPFKTDQV